MAADLLTLPDLANAAFEAVGALVILLNIRRIRRDRLVRGVDWRVMLFFTLWGYWNLYYYPHLDQWLSFAAGLGIVMTNTVYTVLMVYYVTLERRQTACLTQHPTSSKTSPPTR